MIAAELANISNGGDRRSDQSAKLRSEKISQPEAARLLNVSERSVRTAAYVRDNGTERRYTDVNRVPKWPDFWQFRRA